MYSNLNVDKHFICEVHILQKRVCFLEVTNYLTEWVQALEKAILKTWHL